MDRKICVDAGAGAGKTRTAIKFTEENIGKNVIVFTFTKEAQRTFQSRCKSDAKILTIDQMTKWILEKFYRHSIDIINGGARTRRYGLNSKDENKAFDLKQIDLQHSLPNNLNEDYAKCLDRDGYMDHGVILQRVLRLPPKFIDKYRIYDVMVVDESQDLTPAQWAFIELIRGKADLLFVGDPRQNIYTWRGADVKILSDFRKEAEIITLNYNFRSRQEILNVGNVYSKQIDDSLEPMIACRGYGGKGTVQWISRNEIPKYLAHCDLEDTAIISFTHDTLNKLGYWLGTKGFSYKLTKPMYEQETARTAVQIVKVLHFMQENTLKKLMLDRLHDIGDKALFALTVHYQNESLFDCLGQLAYEMDQVKDANGRDYAIIKSKAITDTKKKILADFAKNLSENLDLSDNKSVKITKLFKCLNPIKYSNIEEDVNFKQFLEEFEDVCNIEEYINDFDSGKLAKEKLNAVSIRTIHSIKGDEKGTIFFIADDFGSSHADEVLKMSYVAVTRARDRLFIVGRDSYFDKRLYDSFESLRPMVEKAVKDNENNLANVMPFEKLFSSNEEFAQIWCDYTMNLPVYNEDVIRFKAKFQQYSDVGFPEFPMSPRLQFKKDDDNDTDDEDTEEVTEYHV